MNITEAIHDKHLFGPSFKARGLFTKTHTWKAWEAFLKAAFALPMSDAELEIYQRHTGRVVAPQEPAREVWLSVGRRGGKSRIASLLAVWLACFGDYAQYLGPGERGVVMVMAGDRAQARVLFRYVMALLRGTPMVESKIVSERAESVELSNGIDIEIHTSSFRSVRGYTVIGAILDEVAFWSVEGSSNPDGEVVNALLPAMGTIPGAMLIGLSTPYARHGILWERYRDCYGHDGDTLIWSADSRSMNPTLSQSVVDRAYRDDPQAAAAEYGASFRSDIGAFLSGEMVDRALAHEFELAPVPGVEYQGFCDPSGGAGDHMTLAIGHKEGGLVVLDVLHGRPPPFEPQSVVREFAEVLKRYKCSKVVGDRYSAEWCASAFRDAGITYEASTRSKSEIYLEVEPLFAQGQLRLINHRRLAMELRQLERRTGRGKDVIDHPLRGSDDYANAVCGVAVLLSGHGTYEIKASDWLDLKFPSREVILARATQRFENSATLEMTPWSTNSVAASPPEDDAEREYKADKLREWKARKNLR